MKRKDLGLLLSMVILASVATCGILNLLVFNVSPWSLAVIGACVILWVFMIPAVIYTRQSVYVSLLLDGGAVTLYLYMLTFLSGSSGWFTGLGLPIVVLVHGAGDADQALSGGADIPDLVGGGADDLHHTGHRGDYHALPQEAAERGAQEAAFLNSHAAGRTGIPKSKAIKRIAY